MPTSEQLEQYRELLRSPLISEKSMGQAENEGKYHFEVHPAANKIQIRDAIEALFNVRVTRVNTMNVKGKTRRRSYRHRIGKTALRKKAIVTLAAGDRIDLIQGT